ncbi:hypothetical protein [Bacillus sp. AFS017336]|nr:hypothetical protein [Bacillus sp. AFS017336]
MLLYYTKTIVGEKNECSSVSEDSTMYEREKLEKDGIISKHGNS